MTPAGPFTATKKATGESVRVTCNFLFMCSGYYSYKEGYTPAFPGRERFQGQIVHPQAWPEDLSFAGKKVVIIGSGATAVTLVPAMADTAAHVTMLQRSPTYVASAPDQDAIANALRKVLPGKLAYRITRKKNVALQQFFYGRTRTRPEKVKEALLKRVRTELGEDYDVDTHFTPSYNPWDQRMCLVPNSDLFKSIKSGGASVVTDTIDTFDETGIALTSGEHLDADIIITATGLNLVTLGEMTFAVDGDTIDFSDTWTYKHVVLGGAEPGVHIRLHQRLVDPARRSHERIRLPSAQPHAQHRHRAVHSAAAPVGREHAAAPVDRRLLRRLHAASDAPVPEAG